MSSFSFSNLEDLGNTANESLNSVVSPMYYGDVSRVFSGTALAETLPSHNSFIFGPGTHQKLVLEKPLGSLQGEPGAIVTGLATIKATSKIENLDFKQTNSGNNSSHLVAIESPAKVVFNNCVFQRSASAEASNAATSILCFVLVNSGAKAVFNNCVFQSNGLDGSMINSPGLAIQDLNAVAGSVFVGLGANYSGHAHAATVTNIGGEIT